MELSKFNEIDKFKIFDPCCILVWNIPKKHRNCSNLKKLFSKFGEICEAKLVQSKAIIQFIKKESAQKAIVKKKFGGVFIASNGIEAIQHFNTPDSCRDRLTLDKLKNDCLLHIYSYLSLGDILNLSKVSNRHETVYQDYMNYPIVLDDLNVDCLFEIYSYLSLNDITNLVIVSKRQFSFYQDYDNFKKRRDRRFGSDFLDSIHFFIAKFFKITNFLSNDPLQNDTETMYFLNSKPNSFDYTLEHPPNIKNIKFNFFHFAYMTLEHFYWIENHCPNLETLEINCDKNITLQKFELAKTIILEETKNLKLNDPDSFLKKFIPDEMVREDIKLLLVDIEKRVQIMEKLGKIDSLNLDRAMTNSVAITKLTNKLAQSLYEEAVDFEEVDSTVELNVAGNFKELSVSDLSKKLEILEIDLDFFDITEDHMKYFANFDNLKQLKIYCSPRIWESVEFLKALKKLAKYNKLKILKFNINWVNGFDESGTFVEDFTIKMEEIFWPHNLKISFSLEINVNSLNRIINQSVVVNI